MDSFGPGTGPLNLVFGAEGTGTLSGYRETVGGAWWYDATTGDETYNIAFDQPVYAFGFVLERR